MKSIQAVRSAVVPQVLKLGTIVLLFGVRVSAGVLVRVPRLLGIVFQPSGLALSAVYHGHFHGKATHLTRYHEPDPWGNLH